MDSIYLDLVDLEMLTIDRGQVRKVVHCLVRSMVYISDLLVFRSSELSCRVYDLSVAVNHSDMNMK